MILIYLSVIYFIAVIILAHFFTPLEYKWTKNTISDLGAQGLKYQWIMQAGFIGFGLLLNLGFLLKFITVRQIIYPDILIMLYGLSVLLTGFFSAAPFIDGVRYSMRESNLHSLFATVAGVCFSIGVLARIFTASSSGESWLHVVFLTLVTGTSLGFGLAEKGVIPIGKGIIQRALYLICFCWLIIGLR
jgi:hypothetical membrane protein